MKEIVASFLFWCQKQFQLASMWDNRVLELTQQTVMQPKLM